MKRISVQIIIVFMAVAACGNITGTTPPPGTGIRGRVYRIDAPAIPAGWTPPPFEQLSTIIVENSNGDTVKTAKTDSLGKYEIQLSPGSYFLIVKESLAHDKTGPFTVRSGSMTESKAYFDGGIR